MNAIATTELAGCPLAITADDDGNVLVWDLSASEPVGHPRMGHPTLVGVVAVSWNGPAARGDRRQLWASTVLGSRDRRARQPGGWSSIPVECERRRQRSSAAARSRSPPGEDWTLRIWKLPGGEPIGQPLIRHPGPIHAMSTTTVDGWPVAVTGGHDWTVGIWDLTAGRPAREPLGGHTGPVEAVATGTTAGRPIAVTADSDGLMLLWQLSTGRAIGRQIAKLTGPVEALAVTSLSGRPVAVTSSNMGTLMVWNLDTGESRRRAAGSARDGGDRPGGGRGRQHSRRDHGRCRSPAADLGPPQWPTCAANARTAGADRRAGRPGEGDLLRRVRP